MVKTGFCQRHFGQTNEQQRHLHEKLISELHGEVDDPFKPEKNTFFYPPAELEFYL